MSKQDSSILTDEVEKFSRIAEEWWDPVGKFAPLHKFNPIRVSYIKDKSLTKFTNLEGLDLLDVGCGGGLLSEPLCNIGFNVTGLDASEKNIAIAKAHAKKMELKITYQQGAIEDFDQEKKFDVVLAMEVIEHVNDPEAFINNVAARLKPGGLLFVATLNRTVKSLMFAKFAAEYVLNWLPRGAHDWQKFLKPSEIAAFLSEESFSLTDLSGMSYNLCSRNWKLSKDISQNYVMLFEKIS